MKKKPPELVVVDWLDAVTSNSWETMAEHPKKPLPVKTAGYLVHESAATLVIASTIGDEDVNATTTIPRGMVVKVRRVR